MDSTSGRFGKSLSSSRWKQNAGTNSLPRLKKNNPVVDLNEEHDSSFDIFVNDGAKKSEANNSPIFDLSPFTNLECCPVCLKTCGPMQQHLELCGPKNGVVGERLVVLCQLHKVYLEKRKLMNFPVNFHEIQYQNFEKFKKNPPPKILKASNSKKKYPLFASSQDFKNDIVQQKIELLVADMPELYYHENEEKSLLDVLKIPLWYIAGTDLATLENYYVPDLASFIVNPVVSNSSPSIEALENQQSEIDLSCNHLGLNTDECGDENVKEDKESVASIERRRKRSSIVEQIEELIKPKRCKLSDTSSEPLVCSPVKTAQSTNSSATNCVFDPVFEEDIFEDHDNDLASDENKNLNTSSDQCNDSNKNNAIHTSPCQSSTDLFSEEHSKDTIIAKNCDMDYALEEDMFEGDDDGARKYLLEDVMDSNTNESFCKQPESPVNHVIENYYSNFPSDKFYPNAGDVFHTTPPPSSAEGFDKENPRELIINKSKFPEVQSSETILIESSDEDIDGCRFNVTANPLLQSNSLISSTPSDNKRTLKFESSSNDAQEKSEDSFWSKYKDCPQNDVDPSNLENKVNNIQPDQELHKESFEEDNKLLPSDDSGSISEEPLRLEVQPDSESCYEDMDDDQLKEELSKYGLKRNLGRRKGIMLLNHIKQQLDKNKATEPEEADAADRMSNKTIDFHEKSITEFCGDELFKGGQLEVLAAFIKGNAELHLSLLKFKPVWLDDFQVLLKEQNISISKSKLKKYSDHLGIIYREKQKV